MRAGEFNDGREKVQADEGVVGELEDVVVMVVVVIMKKEEKYEDTKNDGR